MKELLLSCIKEVHFIYEDGIYQQVDSVALGSFLGPILPRNFMVKLETAVVSALDNVLFKWKECVDDTSCFIKGENINFILAKLNSFHLNIQFMFEEENNKRLQFLSVLLRRNRNSLETNVCRKPLRYDMYLNGRSFLPNLKNIKKYFKNYY